MKPSAIVVFVTLLCACSGLPGSTGSATSPAASSARTISPPTVSPAPSLPPIATAAFPSCRLPYLKGASGDKHLTGGFVQGNAGTWKGDPAGGITQSGDFYITDAKPTLRGSDFSGKDTGAYDLALRRWVPVRREQVRNDGLAYAYEEPYKAKSSDPQKNATRIHVVSPANGSDRVIYAGAPRAVMAYEPEGIYVTAVMYYAGEGGSGLWRLNPTTGASTAVPKVQQGWIEAVDHGIAWTDAATIQPRALIRLNLSSGSQETWAYVDEGWVWFVGLNLKGNPLVVVYLFGESAAPGALFVYKTPTVRALIANVSFRQLGVTDSHGTWLSGPDGIYLLDAKDKLTKVSDVTGGTVAGGCN